jgi:hypothetical protein
MQEELDRRIGDSQHQHQQHRSVASWQQRRDGLKKAHSDGSCGDAFLLKHDDKEVDAATAALPSLNVKEEEEVRVTDVMPPTHNQSAASILQSRRSNGSKNHHHGESDNHHHNQWLLDHLHSNITACDLAKTLSRPSVRRSQSDDTASSSTSVLSTLQWYQGGCKNGGAKSTNSGSVGKK